MDLFKSSTAPATAMISVGTMNRMLDTRVFSAAAQVTFFCAAFISSMSFSPLPISSSVMLYALMVSMLPTFSAIFAVKAARMDCSLFCVRNVTRPDQKDPRMMTGITRMKASASEPLPMRVTFQMAETT